MLSIRMMAAGAVGLLLSGIAAAGAQAQSATSQPAGGPLQLLHMLKTARPAQGAKSRPHVRMVSRKRLKRHVKLAEKRPPTAAPAPIAAAAAPATAIPTASPWPDADAAAGPAVAQSPPSAAAASGQAPGQLLVEAAETAPKSDSPSIAPAQQPAGGVGSAAWIMQVLAALGGAAAAGSLAWFLIGSAPQRTYG